MLGLTKCFALVQTEGLAYVTMSGDGRTERITNERFDKELARLNKAVQAQQQHRARPQSARPQSALQQAELANQQLELLLQHMGTASSQLSAQLEILGQTNFSACGD